jgi:hypothetical protein
MNSHHFQLKFDPRKKLNFADFSDNKIDSFPSRIAGLSQYRGKRGQFRFR